MPVVVVQATNFGLPKAKVSTQTFLNGGSNGSAIARPLGSCPGLTAFALLVEIASLNARRWCELRLN